MLLKEYAYCPRYAFFRLELELPYVTESMEAARKLFDPLTGLDPEGWEVRRSVRVASKRLGLWGVADALLVRGGLVKVVEAKALTPVSRRALRGRLRHVLAQAVAYGMCAEETLHLTLQGVVIVGSERVVEERVTPALRAYVEALAAGLRRAARGEDPGPKRGPRCWYCAYRELCWAAPRL